MKASGDGDRTDGQRQFISVANGSRNEGVFIDISAALKLDKGKTGETRTEKL